MLSVIAYAGVGGWFIIGGAASGDRLLLGIGIGLLVAAAFEWARALEASGG